jgi:branched-chain amino acid transport system permease protein
MHTFGQQLADGLLSGAIYVAFASGISLTFGVMRIVNMAHGELAMLGAYGIYAIGIKLGVGFWPGAVVALLAVAAIGAVLNRAVIQPTLRTSQLNVLLTTLAVSIVLVNGVEAVAGSDAIALSTPFRSVLHPLGLSIPETWPVVIAATAVALVLLHLFLTRTRAGQMARATGENPLGARVVGIDTLRVYDYTMAIGALLAGLAGVCFLMTADGDPTLGQPLLLIGFATVIVAGIGSIRGAALVGVWFGVTGALFTQYISSYYSDAYIYGTMILVLLLRPHGLFGKASQGPLRAA